eukprot:5021397-Prymnesium_polylepis.1
MCARRKQRCASGAYLERISARGRLAAKLLLDPVPDPHPSLELVLVTREADALAGTTPPDDALERHGTQPHSRTAAHRGGGQSCWGRTTVAK